MGVIGATLGGIGGKWLATKLSRKYLKNSNEDAHNAAGTVGGAAGAALGGLLPFKKGGRIRKGGKVLLHKGEYLLPKSVRATKKQKKRVKKRGGRM